MNEAGLGGVIFDVDGTLLDSPYAQYEWLKHAAKKYEGNFPFTEFNKEFLETYNSYLTEKGFVGLYDMVGVDFHANNGDIWKEYSDFNQTHPIPLIEGVPEVLQEVYARSRLTTDRAMALRLGLNTTKTWDDIHVPLESILHYFDHRVTKDDVYAYAGNKEVKINKLRYDDYKALKTLLPEVVVKELEKPNGLAAMLSVGRMGVDADRLVVFEDDAKGVMTYKGVIMPQRRVDLYVVGVTWGFEPDGAVLREAGADVVINHPEEIIPILEARGAFE